MNKHKLNKGFTIIEVVLVLAIAGLIFLAVFLALPALQRNQRDTQRKNDMSRFKAAYHQYRANNKGQLIRGVYNYGAEHMAKSADWEKFINEYLRKDGQTFRDPSGEDYFVLLALWDYTRDDKAGTGIITIGDGHVCDYSSTKPINQRIISGNGQTARIWLESGEVYCLDLLN